MRVEITSNKLSSSFGKYQVSVFSDSNTFSRTKLVINDGCPLDFVYKISGGKIISDYDYHSSCKTHTRDYSVDLLSTIWKEVKNLVKFWTKKMREFDAVKSTVIENNTMTFIDGKSVNLENLAFDTLLSHWSSRDSQKEPELLQKFLSQLTNDFGFPSLKEEFAVDESKYIQDFLAKIKNTKPVFNLKKAIDEFEEFKETASTKQFDKVSNDDEEEEEILDEEEEESRLFIYKQEVHKSWFPGSALVQFGEKSKGWNKTGTRVDVKLAKNGLVNINENFYSYKKEGIYENVKNPNKKMRFVLVSSIPCVVVKS